MGSVSKEFAQAFIAMQRELKPVVKDSENQYYHSRYASYAAVWESCKDALQNNGFAVSYGFEVGDGGMSGQTIKDGATTDYRYDNVNILVVRLIHESGEMLENRLRLPLPRNDPQAEAAGVSYFRRYGLVSILGLVDKDDDGNLASGVTVVESAPPRLSVEEWREKITVYADKVIAQNAEAFMEMSEEGIFDKVDKLTSPQEMASLYKYLAQRWPLAGGQLATEMRRHRDECDVSWADSAERWHPVRIRIDIKRMYGDADSDGPKRAHDALLKALEIESFNDVRYRHVYAFWQIFAQWEERESNAGNTYLHVREEPGEKGFKETVLREDARERMERLIAEVS